MRGKSAAVAVTLLLAGLSACTGVPDGVSVVRDFDVDRYLGTWRSSASRPAS